MSSQIQAKKYVDEFDIFDAPEDDIIYEAD